VLHSLLCRFLGVFGIFCASERVILCVFETFLVQSVLVSIFGCFWDSLCYTAFLCQFCVFLGYFVRQSVFVTILCSCGIFCVTELCQFRVCQFRVISESFVLQSVFASILCNFWNILCYVVFLCSFCVFRNILVSQNVQKLRAHNVSAKNVVWWILLIFKTRSCYPYVSFVCFQPLPHVSKGVCQVRSDFRKNYSFFPTMVRHKMDNKTQCNVTPSKIS